MDLKRIIAGAALIAGLTACGNLEESKIAEQPVKRTSKPCEITIDEKYKAHVANPIEGHVCIGDYQVEIPALPYLSAVEKMHPGMPKTEMIKYLDMYGNNNNILEILEVAPLADKRLVPTISKK